MIKKLDNLAILFLVLSGIVWGIMGLYRINVVEYIFDREWLIRIIYVFFGLAFVYHIISCKADRKKRKSKR